MIALLLLGEASTGRGVCRRARGLRHLLLRSEPHGDVRWIEVGDGKERIDEGGERGESMEK
jgi:hypothetical protein